MTEKVFKTYREQAEILESRGMTIADKAFFQKCMERDDYYNVINGYKKYFLTGTSPERYLTGTTFEHIEALYHFDQSLRASFLVELLKIEKHVKSILAYHFSAKYGHDHREYLDINNFKHETAKNRNFAIKNINHIKHDIDRYRHLSAINHYLVDYGYIPLWVLNSVLSFGRIASLYACLKLPDQQQIAEHFALSAAELVGYLYFLDDWRNNCAHGGRIYTSNKEKRYQKIIPNTRYHELMQIPKNKSGNYIAGKTDVTAMLIALKIFSDSRDFTRLAKHLRQLHRRLAKIIPTAVMQSIDREMGSPLLALDTLLEHNTSDNAPLSEQETL